MSDYINKSATLKELERSRKHHANNKRESELLYRCENIIREQPTLSETEIIRKAFERVVERLEDKKWHYKEEYDEYLDGEDLRMSILLEEIIEIVKEECGISEISND